MISRVFFPGLFKIFWPVDVHVMANINIFQIKRDIASETAKEKAMDDMERKRRKIEEKRRAQDLTEFLTRQHRLKLLTKAEQVQKDLEEDIRLLDEVNAFAAVRNETEMGKKYALRKYDQFMPTICTTVF